MLQRHSRYALAGASHFVTTVTSVRGNWFVADQLCRDILEYFEWYRSKHGLLCAGYVLMPDHLHAVLHQESSGMLLPSMMQGFKKITSRRCRPAGYPDQTLWHYRYDDVGIPGPDALWTKLNYLHLNPVRRGLVERPELFAWSSARSYFDDSPGIVSVSKP